jgi:RNA methyltransferase, TrmH family
MITSRHNPKIQWVRNLQARGQERRATELFVVEGVRLVEEAQVSGWDIELVLYTEGLSQRGRKLLESFVEQGVNTEQVAPNVMEVASDTQTSQGILAVIGYRSIELPEQLDFVFIPDGVRDPGNLGTMLRTAAAAGVSAVFLPPGVVDPFSPKVVRAGMGAHFRLPIQSLEWGEIEQIVHDAALYVYLAAAGEGLAHLDCDFRLPLAIVVGGEAEGASRVAQNLADARIHIPMPGGGESLNAAVAAGVLLYEVVRQRLKG